MTEILADFWKMRGMSLSVSLISFQPFDTLTLVDWTYNYFADLGKFGVKDDLLENGFLSICNSYGRKMHAQLYPLIIGILKNEKDPEAVEEDNFGFLFTNAP